MIYTRLEKITRNKKTKTLNSKLLKYLIFIQYLLILKCIVIHIFNIVTFSFIRRSYKFPFLGNIRRCLRKEIYSSPYFIKRQYFINWRKFLSKF